MDKFGIRMIYPTITGGHQYFMNMSALTLTQLRDGGNIDRLPDSTSRNSDGSWRIWASETPRWVMTGGWRNVEMTIQCKLVDAGAGDYIQMYCRGEQHSTNDALNYLGSANKARLRFDGACGFIKELYHETGNSGYSDAVGYTQSGFGAILNRWITWKFVCRNMSANTRAKLEIWVDVNNTNSFTKVIEYSDIGTWSVADVTAFNAYMTYITSLFGTRPPIPYNRDTGLQIGRYETITWAGDYVSFRSDNSTWDFKNASCREISPV